MKVTIAMCEGPHDVAFLSRIMHADGFHTYNEVLKDYPSFVARFITEHVIKGSLSDLNLKGARGGLFLPSVALIKEGNILILFQLNGDRKKDGRRQIVCSFDTLFKNLGFPAPGLPSVTDALSIIYVYDADNKGVTKRLGEINSELAEFLHLKEKASVSHASFDTVNRIKYGAYIFHISDEKDGFGRLEDLILPMMTRGNDDILADTNVLIEKREKRDYVLFRDSNKKKDEDYDKQKASIGIMGQLQDSGAPNAAIIEHSAYITDKDILSDVACLEIIKFINSSF